MTVRQMPGGSRGMVTTDFRGKRRALRRLRVGLAFLSLSALFPGTWALFSPESFFTDFPGLGNVWVGALPPYNEHLVRDVGAFFLAFGVLFAAAAITLGKRLVIYSLIAGLVFAIPHLIFHLDHLDGMEGADAFGQMLVLGLVVVVPLYLLVLTRRSDD